MMAVAPKLDSSYVHSGLLSKPFTTTSHRGTDYSATYSKEVVNMAFKSGQIDILQRILNAVSSTGDTLLVVNSGSDVRIVGPVVRSAGNQMLINPLEYKELLGILEKAEENPVIVEEAIKELAIGWYQDDEANLYYYEGESHWKEVDLKTNKELTEKAILGKLEHIG